MASASTKQTTLYWNIVRGIRDGSPPRSAADRFTRRTMLLVLRVTFIDEFCVSSEGVPVGNHLPRDHVPLTASPDWDPSLSCRLATLYRLAGHHLSPLTAMWRAFGHRLVSVSAWRWSNCLPASVSVYSFVRASSSSRERRSWSASWSRFW